MRRSRELADFDAETAEASLRAVADARGVKAASLIHALRVALTGRSASPGLFEVAVLLGRQATRAQNCPCDRAAFIAGGLTSATAVPADFSNAFALSGRASGELAASAAGATRPPIVHSGSK